MKYKITLFLIAFATYCNAQIVAIPDVNFKNALLTSNCVDADLNGSYESDADLNNDGEIQLSEAMVIQRLKISFKNIANLTGIESFGNLKKLLCNNNVLANLDVSANLNLEYLDCYSNSFVSLNISNLPFLNALRAYPNASLQELTVTYNPNLTTLRVGDYMSTLAGLTSFNCSHNGLTAIYFEDGSDYPNLTTLNASYNQLNYITIPDEVTNLNISNNAFTGYSLSNPTLTALAISNNNLTYLDIYDCPNLNDFQYEGNEELESFSLGNTSITSLIIENFLNLNTIVLSYNEWNSGLKLNDIQLFNLPALTSFSTFNNEFTDLSLSNLANLNEIYVTESPNLNLTLSNLPSLTTYTSEGGNSLEINNMSGLLDISCGTDGNFSVINVSNVPSLETFYLNQWNVTQFSLTNAPNLTTLQFKNNPEATFDLSLNNFPSLSSLTLDLNTNSTFSLSNLPNLTTLSVLDVSTFNLEDLPQLYTLFCSGALSFTASNLPLLHDFTSGGSLTTLNLSNLPNLYSITAASNPVASVSLVNLPALHDIDLNYCYTGQTNNVYNFENLPALHTLNLKNTSVATVTLTNLPSLYDFKIKDNVNITSLNFNNLPNLYVVDLTQCNNLTSTLFTNLASLNTVNIYSCGITSLNLIDLPNLSTALIKNNDDIINNGLVFSNLPSLSNLEITFNDLTSQTFGTLPALTHLNISNNSLHSIDLANLPALSVLDISANQIYLTKLDLSSNPNITSVNYSNGWYYDKLNYINLRNGTNSLTYLNVGTSVKNICVDSPEEKTSLQSLDSSLVNTIFTTYCSFNPAGTFYTMQGNSLLDVDNNGCDVDDIVFPMVHLNITNNDITEGFFANNSGSYQVPFIEGDYIISPALENPSYFTISPSNLEVTFPGENSNPLIQNFCVVPNGNHNDLEIIVLPYIPARPGFDATYKIVYKNKGNQTQSGAINLEFNDAILDYVSASPTFVSQTPNLVTWDFENLKPFETKTITVVFNVNSSQETPAVVSGDVLSFSAEIVGSTDENPADNTGELMQTVVNSFDPNDKTCIEGHSVHESTVGEFVHYMIRFENTGTASAINIVVKDMIDLDKFDLSTLIPLASSHNFYSRIASTGQVEFIFENINLTNTLPNRKGYIAFKIKTKATLVANDTFSNRVNIYFDYNNPIITNNYITTIFDNLDTSDHQINDTVFIYPNPVTHTLFFKTHDEVNKVELFDINGRIISSRAITEQMMDVRDVSAGIYLLKIYTSQNIFTQKIIKK